MSSGERPKDLARLTSERSVSFTDLFRGFLRGKSTEHLEARGHNIPKGAKRDDVPLSPIVSPTTMDNDNWTLAGYNASREAAGLRRTGTWGGISLFDYSVAPKHHDIDKSVYPPQADADKVMEEPASNDAWDVATTALDLGGLMTGHGRETSVELEAHPTKMWTFFQHDSSTQSDNVTKDIPRTVVPPPQPEATRYRSKILGDFFHGHGIEAGLSGIAEKHHLTTSSETVLSQAESIGKMPTAEQSLLTKSDLSTEENIPSKSHFLKMPDKMHVRKKDVNLFAPTSL